MKGHCRVKVGWGQRRRGGHAPVRAVPQPSVAVRGTGAIWDSETHDHFAARRIERHDVSVTPWGCVCWCDLLPLPVVDPRVIEPGLDSDIGVAASEHDALPTHRVKCCACPITGRRPRGGVQMPCHLARKCRAKEGEKEEARRGHVHDCLREWGNPVGGMTSGTPCRQRGHGSSADT
jgi:hypothetical protein